MAPFLRRRGFDVFAFESRVLFCWRGYHVPAWVTLPRCFCVVLFRCPSNCSQWLECTLGSPSFLSAARVFSQSPGSGLSSRTLLSVASRWCPGRPHFGLSSYYTLVYSTFSWCECFLLFMPSSVAAVTQTVVPAVPGCRIISCRHCCAHQTDHDLDHLDPVIAVMVCCARFVSYGSHPANMLARAVPCRSHPAN